MKDSRRELFDNDDVFISYPYTRYTNEGQAEFSWRYLCQMLTKCNKCIIERCPNRDMMDICLNHKHCQRCDNYVMRECNECKGGVYDERRYFCVKCQLFSLNTKGIYVCSLARAVQHVDYF